MKTRGKRGPSPFGTMKDAARLMAVEERILQLQSSPQIVRAIMTEFGVCQATVNSDIVEIKTRLVAQTVSLDPLKDATQVRIMLEDSYRVARDNHDAKAMVQASRVFAEISGQIAAKKLDVTTAGKPLHNMTEEELERRISELEALTK